MIEATKIMIEKHGLHNLKLTLTDLYPNRELAKEINGSKNANISYVTTSIDATNVPVELSGVRTMVCSFHHMNADTAKKILMDAKARRQPICIYEISDNSFPILFWWVALPFNFLTTFFITPFVRPLTLKQIIFTYLIPIIPFFFAWDGAVSNARTYTLNDLDLLIEGSETQDYKWEKGIIPGKAKKIFLLGLPQPQ
jgi:hypothetical protein